MGEFLNLNSTLMLFMSKREKNNTCSPSFFPFKYFCIKCVCFCHYLVKIIKLLTLSLAPVVSTTTVKRAQAHHFHREMSIVPSKTFSANVLFSHFFLTILKTCEIVVVLNTM